MTSEGQLHFDQARYQCSSSGKVVLETTEQLPDGPDPNQSNETDVQVTITTSAGDCDTFWLLRTAVAGQNGLWRYETLAFPIEALAWPAPTLGCVDPLNDGDGIVMIADDGWMRVDKDLVPPVLSAYAPPNSATARTWCRNVGLIGATVSDPCSPLPTRNDQLEPEEPALIEVVLSELGASVGALSGTLTAERDEVIVAAPVVFTEDPAGVFTGRFDVWIDGDIVSDCPGAQMDPPLRFTVELSGEDGFTDRVIFSLPLNCGPAGGLPLARPGEVDPMSLRVIKAGTAGQDLRLDWAASPDASVYNVWEGDLSLLHRGAYSHVIPDVGATELLTYCDVGATTSTIASAAGASAPNHYYLVTAEIEPPCAMTISHDGPAGYPDGALSALLPADLGEIPAGRRVDPDCQ